MSQKNLGFLYICYIAKKRGFPPVYKVERVAKMSVKRAFFSVFQKIMVVCCAIFFGFSNAFSANLPSGYTELEYIENSGTQYIDTGVETARTQRIEYDVQLNHIVTGVDPVQVLGTGGASSGILYSARFEPDTNIKIYTTNTHVDTNNSQDLNRHKITLDILNHTFSVDNDSYTMEYNLTGTSYKQYLFAYSRLGQADTVYGFKGKMYSAKIWDNNTLVRDFIPAKDSSGVVGMYDTVNNVFYQNAGTGEFTAGPVVPENPIKIATTAYNTARFNPVINDLNSTVATIRDIVTNTINQTAAIASLQADKQTRPEDACPAGKKCLLVETEENGVIVPHWYEIIENIYGLPTGYTPLEYIQSDGASYLIVPYRVNNKTVFYCRYNEIQKGPQIASAVFGVTDSPDVSKANYGILRLLDGASTFNRMGWGDSTSGSIIDVNAPQNLDTWYEVLYDQNKLYQNNTLYATSATQPSTSWTANYDLGIFARNGSSVTMPAVAKISSVWAKENGEYKINLVPAKRNSDNVIGMYDTVNDVFYTNSGTGTFTAGPEM